MNLDQTLRLLPMCRELIDELYRHKGSVFDTNRLYPPGEEEFHPRERVSDELHPRHMWPSSQLIQLTAGSAYSIDKAAMGDIIQIYPVITLKGAFSETNADYTEIDHLDFWLIVSISFNQDTLQPDYLELVIGRQRNYCSMHMSVKDREDSLRFSFDTYSAVGRIDGADKAADLADFQSRHSFYRH